MTSDFSIYVTLIVSFSLLYLLSALAHKLGFFSSFLLSLKFKVVQCSVDVFCSINLRMLSLSYLMIDNRPSNDFVLCFRLTLINFSIKTEFNRYNFPKFTQLLIRESALFMVIVFVFLLLLLLLYWCNGSGYLFKSHPDLLSSVFNEIFFNKHLQLNLNIYVRVFKSVYFEY